MSALRALLLCLLVVVAGCARISPAPGPSDGGAAATHDARVGGLRDWQLAGRIAIQREDQGFSADLRWRQQGETYDLRVMAPLNGGTFALQGDTEGVIMITPKGERYAASDPEILMRQHLGWSIALGGARYWVRGLPRAGAAVTQPLRDGRGRYTDFAQDGWRISILDYVEQGDASLPRRLFMANDRFEVRLAITRWEDAAPVTRRPSNEARVP